MDRPEVLRSIQAEHHITTQENYTCWVCYGDHLETVVEQLVEDDKHHVREIEELRGIVANLQAKLVQQTSKVLDDGHTGEYRPVPRRDNGIT